jgi:putative spermidine/putrescine transport system ATP-binding protein
MTSLPISIRSLTKAHGALTVLDGVDLDVRSGEFMTLLGPSGSGKTTLLMVIAGFIRPSSGQVLVGDKDMTRVPPHRRDLGMVFQNYALFPHMTVGENVAYPLKRRSYSKAEIDDKVRSALRIVQLEALIDRYPSQLSGGQKQRIALARAVSFDPRILLMDEPLSALDKKLREHMQIEIRDLHDRLGITTIYVTHDQREALTMSDRIAVINEGRIAQVDAPAALYEKPKNLFVADFIGDSTILPLQREAGRLMLNGAPIHLACEPQAIGEKPHLVIRPEKLEVLRDGQLPAGQNLIEGALRSALFQGDSVLVQVELADGAVLSLRQPGRQNLPEPGHRIRLGLPVADTVVLAGA